MEQDTSQIFGTWNFLSDNAQLTTPHLFSAIRDDQWYEQVHRQGKGNLGQCGPPQGLTHKYHKSSKCALRNDTLLKQMFWKLLDTFYSYEISNQAYVPPSPRSVKKKKKKLPKSPDLCVNRTHHSGSALAQAVFPTIVMAQQQACALYSNQV